MPIQIEGAPINIVVSGAQGPAGPAGEGTDLTSGPVTSSAGVSAIAANALTISMTSGLQTALDDRARLSTTNTFAGAVNNFQSVVATGFTGPGTGLTGTASGLSIGGSAVTLTTSRTIGGSLFDGSANVTSFPSPGAIGGTTPSTGSFTTLTASGTISTGTSFETPATGGLRFVDSFVTTLRAEDQTDNRSIVLPNADGTVLLTNGSAAALTNIPAGQLTGSIDIARLPAVQTYETIGIACSDMTTVLTTGEKVAFDMPYNFTVRRVYASLAVAPTVSALTLDIEDEGTSLLNAVLSIGTSNNNAETSTFAAAASTYALTKGDRITIDIDSVGSSNAGLIVFLEGIRS